MGVQVLYPISEKTVDNRDGKHIRILEVYVPDTTADHEVECGEPGITGAAQIAGPGTLTFTAPAGTTTTGGLSSRGSQDESTRVEIDTTSVKGLYTIVVIHEGRGASL